MNKPTLIAALAVFSPFLCAQPLGQYDVSNKHPFGRLNPDAAKAVSDYQGLIGQFDCTNVGRNTDGSWKKPLKMQWQFKYILNGRGVQDETLREDGSSSGSIRQYDPETGLWNVHFYTTNRIDAPLRFWQGKKEKDQLILTRAQKSFDGKPGFTRLTFHDIKRDGFSWLMEWSSQDKSMAYAVRKISCKRRS